jgi:hypothetical protein
MKKSQMRLILLISGYFFFFWLGKAFPQYAPLTLLGSGHTTDAEFIIPVTVSDFENIGSFQLVILYEPAIASANLVNINSNLIGSFASNISAPGQIAVSWFKTTVNGANLPDNTTLLNIAFSKTGNGTCPLQWDESAYACLWFDATGQMLDQDPFSDYYINGSLTFAPLLISHEQVPYPLPVHSPSATDSKIQGLPQIFSSTQTNPDFQDFRNLTGNIKSVSDQTKEEISKTNTGNTLLITAFSNNLTQQITLRYFLPSAGSPVIRVYNIAGQRILAYDLPFKPAGAHDLRVSLNMAGIYLATIMLSNDSGYLHNSTAIVFNQ